MQVINYAVTYKNQNISDSEYDLVYSLYNLFEPQKVLAIKFIRMQYGLGLKEAKDICDKIGAYPRNT